MLATYRGITKTHTVPRIKEIKPFKLIKGQQYKIEINGYFPDVKVVVAILSKNNKILTLIPYQDDWKSDWTIDEY